MSRIVLILAFLFAPGSAAFSLDHAQATPIKSVAKTAVRPARPLSELALKANLDDLAFAHADATAHGAKERMACWAAWNAAVVSTQAVRMAVKGLAHANRGGAAKLEAQLQSQDAFGPTSPFVIACTPVAKRLGLDLRTFVQSAVK